MGGDSAAAVTIKLKSFQQNNMKISRNKKLGYCENFGIFDCESVTQRRPFHSFIGKRGNRKTGFQNFMKHYLEHKKGDLVDVDTGAVVGSHNGIHNFTLGQRLRLTGMQDKVDT